MVMVKMILDGAGALQFIKWNHIESYSFSNSPSIFLPLTAIAYRETLI